MCVFADDSSHTCTSFTGKIACHKLNPSGGAGAVNAMHDATVLANYINALPLHPVVNEIECAFESYRAERIEWVERAFNTSQMLQALVAKVRGKVPLGHMLI